MSLYKFSKKAAIKYNFILISIDTLQADHLSCYGYHKTTSPNIDKFAKKSILFKNAYSQYNTTFPAHAAIFTGLHPIIIRAHNPDVASLGIISKKIKTLGEIFKKNGYRTAAFSDGLYVAGKLGFNRGFEIYTDNYRTGIKINLEKAKAYIKSLKSNEPFFIFLHTYDVHSPYKPGPYIPADDKEYRPIFVDNKYSGRIKNYIGKYEMDKFLGNISINNDIITERESNYLISNYDSCIRYVDKKIGEFLLFLKNNKLDKKSIIIITADHGEQFFPTKVKKNNYLVTHFICHEGITSKILKIPLILFIPGEKPAVVHSLINANIDILPTILKVLNFDFHVKYKLSGKALLPVKKIQNQKKMAVALQPFYGYSFIDENNQYIIHNENSRNKVVQNLLKNTLPISEVPEDIIIHNIENKFHKYNFSKEKTPINSIFVRTKRNILKSMKTLNIKNPDFIITKLNDKYELDLKFSSYLSHYQEDIIWSNPLQLQMENPCLKITGGIWYTAPIKNNNNVIFEIYIDDQNTKEKISKFELGNKRLYPIQDSVGYTAENSLSDPIDLSKFKYKKIKIGLRVKSDTDKYYYFWKDLIIKDKQNNVRLLQKKEKLKSLGYIH